MPEWLMIFLDTGFLKDVFLFFFLTVVFLAGAFVTCFTHNTFFAPGINILSPALICEVFLILFSSATS
jgi:hypothetical protein